MKVSIIISNYDYGRFLTESIESALGQEYGDTEVIVVDDGSTDDSLDVIEGFARQITPVLKKNGGQASAFNAGYAAATGDVVIFLDADDALDPPAAERAITALASSSAVKSHWRLREVDEAGRDLGRLVPRAAPPEGDLREAILRGGVSVNPFPPTSGNAFTSRFLDEVMPVPEAAFRRCADAYLLRLAAMAGPVVTIDQPLGRYRIHGDNLYAGRTGIDRARILMEMYEPLCSAISNLCNKRGCPITRQEIAELDDNFQLMTRLLEVTRELPRIVPDTDAVLLVDDNEWGWQWGTPGTIAGRRARILMSRGDVWWGRPRDDEEAVAELQRCHQSGIRFVVVAREASWWLDHYRGFAAYLSEHGRSVFRSDYMTVHELVRLAPDS